MNKNELFENILNEDSFPREMAKNGYEYTIRNEQIDLKKFLKNYKLTDDFMKIVLPVMDPNAAEMFRRFKKEYGKWPKLNLNGTDSIQATISLDKRGTVKVDESYDGELMSRAFQDACTIKIGEDPKEARKYADGKAPGLSVVNIKRKISNFMVQYGDVISVAAVIAIPIVLIGSYCAWSIVDDIDLSEYYDGSFKKEYSDMANLVDMMQKTHVSYSRDSNGNVRAHTTTESSNFQKAEEAYYRIKRYAKKHDMTMGDAAKKVFHSAEWKVLFSTFGWTLSEDEDNVYLNMNFLGRTNKSEFANQKFKFSKHEYADEAEKSTETVTYDDIPGVSFNWTESQKINKERFFESLLNS